MKEEIYAYDFETFPNLTLVTFEQIYGTKKYFWYLYVTPGTKKIICNTNLPGSSLYSPIVHFKPYRLVGFNNVRFDQLIYQKLIDLLTGPVLTEQIPLEIFNAAQDIIGNERARINYKPHPVSQLDAYLILHFNNPARATSLKWIECHLGMPVIQDLPFNFDDVIAIDEIETVKDYCFNDVAATKQLYLTSQVQDRLKVRAEIRKTYPSVQMNHPDSTLGERIFVEELEKESFPLPKPLPFEDIRVVDIILPYIDFKTHSFKQVYDHYRMNVITDPNSAGLETSVIYDGMKYDFGSGGLHAARKGDYLEIDSEDVSSFYPNLSIKNGFKPRHLGTNFTKVYNGIYEKRQLYPKKTAPNESYKIALNSAFGKGNSQWSPLYDPKFLFSITINGQLLLALLCEMLTESGAAEIIMANTDGIEFKTHHTSIKDRVLKEWQALTGLKLESSYYRRLIVRDVNNYIGFTNKGEVKAKGAYELNKDFNKDPSQRASVIQVHNAVSGKKQPDTGSFNSYFMYLRAKTGTLAAKTPDGSFELDLSGTIRYVVVKKEGYHLFRKNGKKYTAVHKGKRVAFCNDMTSPEFDKAYLMSIIDKDWYESEAEKLYRGGYTEHELFTQEYESV